MIMVKTMKPNTNIKNEIHKDLYRYTGEIKTGYLAKSRFYGWQYTKIWRKANYFCGRSRLLYLLYGFLLYKKSIKYGFQISPKAQIGSGLYLGHFGTIIVGSEVVIGNNVNLNPNVVIGRENRGNREGSPIIGNNVWIGTGSVIVGRIKIGNNVLVAPNSYINFDIPDNSLVFGNPATVKMTVHATEKYICNIVE